MNETGIRSWVINRSNDNHIVAPSQRSDLRWQRTPMLKQ